MALARRALRLPSLRLSHQLSRSIHSMIVRNLIGAPASLSDAVPTYNVVHPGTAAVVHGVEKSSSTDLRRAVDTAHAALPAWKNTSLEDRKKIVERAAQLVEDKDSGWAERLHNANLAETSCTAWWSQEQLNVAPLVLRTLAGFADTALQEETVQMGPNSYILSREPYGVCLAIAAWNAVHLLTARAIVTPLLAGNTVVLKTSEQTPYAQSLWAELLYAAGLPREALSVVHIATEDAPGLIPELVGDKRVRHVNFTGSTRVGAIVAGLAGKNLKPTVMELGGKAPAVILPDADLSVAASHLIFGAFMNAGQICMSTERVLVPASRYDELVAALRAAWDSVEKKQPRALFSSASAARVRELVMDAQTKGAHDVFEGKTTSNGVHAASGNAYIHPLILGPVDSKMRLHTEESFGPLCVLVQVPDAGRSEDEVIDNLVALANDTEYGLSASVWGKDLERATKVARRLEAGAVHVNSPTPADPPVVPHGGWKSSGWGRFNGVEGIRSFTQMRSIEVPGEKGGPMPLNVFEL